MDLSGSMTGKKKEIAKHVALNILDTLNDDDFFTIMKVRSCLMISSSSSYTGGIVIQ